jgi:hypothetical protein
MTKIEEVARAIGTELSAQDYVLVTDGNLTDVIVDGHFDLEKVAIAAMVALREPNAAMIEAAVDADIPGGRWGEPGFRESRIDEKDAPVIWRAVIDAALAEHKP